MDPTVEEVEENWHRDTGREATIEGVKLEFIQHVQLSYAHRNALVHEFRMLGQLGAAPSWSIEMPYYSGLRSEQSRETLGQAYTWELQYPLPIYERLVLTSLDKLEPHLLSNGIDPFPFYSQGTYWLNDLN